MTGVLNNKWLVEAEVNSNGLTEIGLFWTHNRVSLALDGKSGREVTYAAEPLGNWPSVCSIDPLGEQLCEDLNVIWITIEKFSVVAVTY